MAQNVRATGVSLPIELITEIDELARNDRRTRSAWIALALREIIDLRAKVTTPTEGRNP